jgi:hypothetical protein
MHEDVRHRARAFVRALGVACALAPLGACGRPGTAALAPQEAAHWLQAACGISYATEPVVLKGSLMRSKSSAGSSLTVIATLSLPEAETAAALTALAGNRTLHRRGQVAARYSYESFPDVRPERECELDTAMHVLYFRYAE